MRLGLYGGMANNMYVFAKALASSNRDIVFIRDRTDTYPLSQPVWEDCRIFMKVTGNTSWDWDFWSETERKLNWTPPRWLIDPVTAEPPRRFRIPRVRPRPENSASRAIHQFLECDKYWAKLLRWFRSCDLLIVCGIEGEQIASVSGVPYLIWPHGGDICLAAGYPSADDVETPNKKAFKEQQERLAHAFKQAKWIGSHDPTGVGGPFCDTAPALAGKSLSHIPLPVPKRERPVAVERRRLRQKLFEELALPSPRERTVAFVPSRMDFVWKGHDRLLQAAATISDVHYVFAGWGDNYDQAISRARKFGLSGQMTFLPFALSKPLLFEMFEACDMVIDQFIFGSYGTTMVEAMAGGVPVIMHIDNASFLRRGWEPPPVLNCHTVGDIRNILIRIATNPSVLEEMGCLAHRWHKRVHDPSVALSKLDSLLSSPLSHFVSSARKYVGFARC